MPKARLVFDGDNIYTEKDARIYKLKNDISSKIDGIPGVVDSLDSISSTDALSANMGRTLQDQINSLSGTGKFLSTWDCTTGLPGTNPQEDPYTYKVGDYYVVSVTGATNYRPHGGTYTQGVPSTAVELENVGINDKYYFDGANWVRIPDTAIQISIDSALSTTSTNAVENRAIATAVNGKQDIITDLSTIRAGAAAGATALQKLDNISELTNNIGYQTAGDVNSAIQAAIGQLPTVNDGVLTIQKNSSTIDTFSANSASNKTINIGVPTTVAELSDANDYATKTYVNDAIDGLIHEGSTAPSNPQEGDLWYDTVNHVLKIYNGTSWETVDTDTNTTYTAGNGINISAQNEISIDTSVVATQSDIPTVNNATLTIQKNSTDVATFTANASSNVTADISVPTTVAELSDANDYATKTYVDNAVDNISHTGSTAPVNPTEGQLWYDTTNDKLYVYDGSNWIELGTLSGLISGTTFGAFAKACLASGAAHNTTLNKYYKSSGGQIISDRGTATYTMQGLGFFTGMGWSANSGTVSIAVNGLTIWSNYNTSGNYTTRYLDTPITLSPGDEVSVTMSQYGNGDIYADISDFY